MDSLKARLSKKSAALWYGASIVVVAVMCGVAMFFSLDYDYHAIVVAYVFYLFYEKPLYDQAVHNGFQAVQSPGRLERVRTAPTVLLDACHNPHGAKALARALDTCFEFNRLVGVLAILGDKDARGILEALEPVLDKVILTTNSSPRTLPVEDLAEIARQVFDAEQIDTAPTLADAIALATVEAENIDENGVMSGAGVIVTGSVVTAGEARSLFRKAPA